MKFEMKTMEMLRTIALIGFARMVTSCRAPDRTRVAQIGRWEITRSDIQDRDAVSRIFYPETRESVGDRQLESAFVHAEIAQSLGLKLDDTALEAEAARIERETRDPERLKQIQNVFGSRRGDYLKVFVLPTLVERSLYFELFLNRPALHSSEWQTANELHRRALRDPTHLERFAAERNLTVFRVEAQSGRALRIIEPSRGGHGHAHAHAHAHGDGHSGAQADDPKARAVRKELEASRDSASDRWLADYAGKVKVPGVYPEVIDQGEGFLVLRVDRKSRTKAEFTGVSVSKRDFGAWVEEERKKIAIRRF